MTKILLVRHGQTDHNQRNIMQGLLDTPLNEEGTRQATLAAAWLKAYYPPDVIYTSNLQRARKTAAAIAQASNAPLYLAPALREIDVGRWQGISYAEAQAEYPEVWEALRSDPVNTRRPNGESFADVSRRATACLTDVANKHIGETICLVSHGLTLRALLTFALGVAPVPFSFRLAPSNTGISLITWQEGNWGVEFINSTAHLLDSRLLIEKTRRK